MCAMSIHSADCFRPLSLAAPADEHSEYERHEERRKRRGYGDRAQFVGQARCGRLQLE